MSLSLSDLRVGEEYAAYFDYSRNITQLPRLANLVRVKVLAIGKKHPEDKKRKAQIEITGGKTGHWPGLVDSWGDPTYIHVGDTGFISSHYFAATWQEAEELEATRRSAEVLIQRRLATGAQLAEEVVQLWNAQYPELNLIQRTQYHAESEATETRFVASDVDLHALLDAFEAHRARVRRFEASVELDTAAVTATLSRAQIDEAAPVVEIPDLAGMSIDEVIITMDALTRDLRRARAHYFQAAIDQMNGMGWSQETSYGYGRDQCRATCSNTTHTRHVPVGTTGRVTTHLAESAVKDLLASLRGEKPDAGDDTIDISDALFA